MRKLFTTRLAVSNLLNNKSTYFPYMLTCICSIMLFYSMLSISQNPGIAAMPGSAALQSLLLIGTVVIGIFTAILLFYTNSFLIKRRKKELGLYSILGLEKRHIAKVLFFETLIIALISLLLGLLAGVLFSKLAFLVLLNILHVDPSLAFVIDPTALGHTAALFAVVFLLTLCSNFWQIKVASPIRLLQGGNQGEKEPKTKWVLTILGVLTLGGGYAIAVTVQTPMEAILLFFVAVILVMIGTYALFTAGSIALLKLLKRKKKFYYKPNNFISVSGMIYRMKQNAVGLANICLLCTAVLVVVSATVSLYAGKNDVLNTLFAYDLSMSITHEQDQTLFEEDTADAILEQIDSTASRHKIKTQNLVRYHQTNLYGTMIASGSIQPDNQYQAGERDAYMVCLLPVEDWNQVTGQNDTLGPDEIFLFSNKAEYQQQTLTLGSRTYQVKQQLEEFPLTNRDPNTMVNIFYIGMPDQQCIDQTALDFDDQPLHQIILSYNLEGADDDQLAFSQALRQQCPDGMSIESRPEMDDTWYAFYGGFLFLGIFFGSLFLVATVLIIYYKQISEGYDDHDRFAIMRKVGMSDKEIKKTIHKQIMLVFFLPLAVALVHILFAFPVISKMLVGFGLTNTMLYFLCTMLSVLLFACIYALVYSLTAKVYYRLVRN